MRSRFNCCLSASTIHNTLRLAYKDSTVPMSVTLSQLLLKETLVHLNESRLIPDVSDLRGSSLLISVWNSGTIDGNFAFEIQCASGMK